MLNRQEYRLAGKHLRHRPRRAAALDRVRDIDVPALAHEQIEPALAAVGSRLIGHAGEAAAVPHQHRHLALSILRQDVLHVHLLDEVGAILIELLGRAADRDLAHRLAFDLDQTSAEVERAHVAIARGSLVWAMAGVPVMTNVDTLQAVVA